MWLTLSNLSYWCTAWNNSLILFNLSNSDCTMLVDYKYNDVSYTFCSKSASDTLFEMIRFVFAKVTFATDKTKRFLADNLILDADLPLSCMMHLLLKLVSFKFCITFGLLESVCSSLSNRESPKPQSHL